MSDEYYGHGGSYVIDAKTGARKLAERTNQQATPVKPAPPAPSDTDEVE